MKPDSTTDSTTDASPQWVAVEPQPDKSVRVAPPGTIFVCRACGKTNHDIMNWRGGWDESCSLNAVLCYDPKEGEPNV